MAGLESVREDCEICGELFTGSVHEEIGEFYDPAIEEGLESAFAHVIAHAQCGRDQNLELA